MRWRWFILLLALLIGPASANFAIFQVSTPPPTFTPAWQTLKIGGSGLVTSATVYPDGTMFGSTDTNGVYIWRPGATAWSQLFQESAFSSLYPATSVEAGFPAGYGAAACAYPIDSSATLVGSTNTIYASWNDLIWKSTNNGVTFTNTGKSVPNDGNSTGRYNGPYIVCDPASNGLKVYTDVASGIAQVSSDGGSTWGNVPNLAAASSGQDTTFAIDPTSSVVSNVTQHLFAAVYGTGLYESYNGGASFTLANTTGMPTTFGDLKVDKFGVVWTVSFTSASKYVPNGTAGAGAWTNLSGVSTVQTTNGVTIDSSSASQGANRIAISDQKGGIQISTNNGGAWSSPSYAAFNNKPTATDVPWLNAASYNASQPQCCDSYLQMQKINFDPSSNLIAAIGVGVLSCLAPVSSSACSGSGWIDKSAGIEQLVVNRIISPPGNGPFMLGWDRGIFGPLNPDVYPSTQYDTLVDIAGAWDADYSGADPMFMAVLNTSNIGRGDFSGFTTNGGHSWTTQAINISPGYPTIPNGQGGEIAVADSNNWALIPGRNQVLYCTQNGGSAWGTVSLSGSPSQNWESANTPQIGGRHILAADRITANTFYVYNYNDGVYSGGCGATWSKVFSGNPGSSTVGWGYNAAMVTVPGQAANLFFISGQWIGNSHPLTGATMQRSTNGGSTWSPVSNVTEVYGIGFGAPKPGNSYPAIYIDGWYNGVKGIFQSNDNAVSFQNTNLSVVYANGNLSAINGMSGDMNVYGRIYEGTNYHGAGGHYYDTSDACPWVNFDPTSATIFPKATVTGTVTLKAIHSGLVPVTSVSFYVDGALIGTQTTGSGTPTTYSQSWVTGGVATGAHTLKVQAVGNGCSASGNSFSIPITTSFLMKRDLAPVANDNDPMWIEKAA
jgi:xyloglucan-specific exo-beta-1,4-glucanase